MNAKIARLDQDGDSCQLLLPRPSLAGCVFAAVVRDTRRLKLAPQDRINYFPATPYCGITLFFEGEGVIASNWAAAAIDGTMPAPTPAIHFNGPHHGPTISVNPGPIYVILIAFHPEAMQALCGFDMAAHVDRISPARHILPPWLNALCEAASKSGDALMAFERIQDGLEAPWREVRPAGSNTMHFLSDWTRHVSARAAASGTGRSLRQIERRVKSWTGQTQRDLIAHSRAERAFIEAMLRLSAERENWAQLAIDSGFSDQSHLVRDVCRKTGFPPERLRQRIKTEPAFWCYRLLGKLY